jgi:magnesium chelatase subunit D
MSPPAYPFTAIVGQDALAEALLACAVDPRIGGVLVRGERGTAKSTAVRALAPLLPAVRTFAGCRFAADPEEPTAAAACPDGPHDADAVVERPVALVELPVGATADRLLGTLDLERALRDGAARLEPGLLAAAHRGLLYVDEVNLLPDHLVDVLLDAAAMGRAHVERDGLSASHPARFVLVGTMNPEEGELRPQLLDRFGLAVDVAGSADAAERVEVVRRRLAFDADPDAFRARFAGDEAAVAASVAAARGRLDGVRLGERELLLISGLCARLGVDGLRADIVTARTARALAVLDGAEAVGEDHVRRAALLALAHRRRRGPLDPPGLSEDELEEAMDEARADAGAGPRGDGDGDGPEGDGPAGGPPDEPGEDAPDAPAPALTGDGADTGGAHGAADGGLGRETGPAGAARDHDAPAEGPGRARTERPGRAPAPERRERPAALTAPPHLRLAGTGHGAAGRRSRSVGREGQPVDVRAAPGCAVDLDLALAATVRAAARRRAAGGTALLRAEDLHEHVRAGREGNLVVFCVDASGSMGARRRMGAVKGAVLGLLLDAYRRRDRVALVTFRATGAELVLAPTASVERAAAALEDLPTGGTTPLAAGLHRATALVTAEARRDPARRALVLVVTDGRASGGREGRAAAAHAAAQLARAAAGVVVFDAEEGPVRLGLASAVAQAAGARLLPLEHLTPQRSRRAA